MRLPLLLLTLLAAGCAEGVLHLEPLGDGPVRTDSAGPDLTRCGFEGGDLSGFGRPGETSYISERGGKVLLVAEGDDFSALRGEEELDLPGGFAVTLRSNDAGDPDTVAVITSAPFVPGHDVFVVDHLSEVGPEGIALVAEVLSEAEEVLERIELEPATGGFVPELLPEHAPIPGFPQITEDGGAPGEFTRDLLDLSPYREAGEPVRMRFSQHTRVPDNGFFTLLDNLCDGEPEE